MTNWLKVTLCWCLLSSVERLNIWISFLTSIEKNCPKTKGFTSNAQGWLDTQWGIPWESWTKACLMRAIRRLNLRICWSTKSTKNIWRTTKSRWGRHKVWRRICKVNSTGSEMPKLQNFCWKLKKSTRPSSEKSTSSETEKSVSSSVQVSHKKVSTFQVATR